MKYALNEKERELTCSYWLQLLKGFRAQGASEDVIALATFGFVAGIRSMKPEMDNEQAEILLGVLEGITKKTK